MPFCLFKEQIGAPILSQLTKEPPPVLHSRAAAQDLRQPCYHTLHAKDALLDLGTAGSTLKVRKMADASSQCLKFRVWVVGLKFGVWSLGFEVESLGCWV